MATLIGIIVIDGVARESGPVNTKMLVHLPPWHFWLDFLEQKCSGNKKNGPVLCFQLILNGFWCRGDLKNAPKRADLLSAVKNGHLGAPNQGIVGHFACNRALFPTNWAHGTCQWWFFGKFGHFSKIRSLIASRFGSDRFCVVGSFWHPMFSPPESF